MKYFTHSRDFRFKENNKINLSYYYHKIFHPQFVFNNKKYDYFCHQHNNAWKNERTVEVPIIWEIITKNQNKKILEVGNVLGHYYQVNHDILDKYEKQSGIINQDITTFKPKVKYDLIISISTLEHIGCDEEPRQPGKVIAAFNNLKNNCLKKGDIMVITMPWGYNQYLDQLIIHKKIKFNQIYFLKRISYYFNQWQQTSWEEIINCRYNVPFPYANAVIIGYLFH